MAFTLSGGGEDPGPPGPKPTPKPVPEPEFTEDEEKQPTLRLKDESVDGWVEYLQSLLIKHLGDSIEQEINGKFDKTTEENVKKFQREHKPKPLMVDGIVGNQTWAALRKAPDEAPGTDKREPHTFVEHGPKARWACEKTDFGIAYDAQKDELLLAVISVGDDRIDDFQAKVRVTPPQGKAQEKIVQVGPPTAERETGAGHVHKVRVPNFAKTFGPGEHRIEAKLEKRLGGDNFDDTFTLNEPGATGGVVVTVTNQVTRKPIGRASVQIDTFSSETGQDGLVVFKGLQPGKHPFRVIARGLQEAKGTIDVSNDADAPANTLLVPLKPASPPHKPDVKTGKLTAKITSEGKPISGQVVTVLSDDGAGNKQQVKSDESGIATFTLPGGNYVVSCKVPPFAMTVTVVAGQQETVTFNGKMPNGVVVDAVPWNTYFNEQFSHCEKQWFLLNVPGTFPIPGLQPGGKATDWILECMFRGVSLRVEAEDKVTGRAPQASRTRAELRSWFQSNKKKFEPFEK